jgi:hypothetical protein
MQPLSDATHFGFEGTRKVLEAAGGKIMVSASGFNDTAENMSRHGTKDRRTRVFALMVMSASMVALQPMVFCKRMYHARRAWGSPQGCAEAQRKGSMIMSVIYV